MDDRMAESPSAERRAPRAGRPAPARGRALSRALAAAAVGLAAIGLWDAGGEPAAEAKEHPGGKGVFEHGCRVQSPQRFLERRSFLHRGMLDLKAQTRAVRYLAERYGHVDDEATPRYSGKSAHAQAKGVMFMSLPLSIHAKIAPAVACVERRIAKTCGGAAHYTPRAVGGFRTSNTYRGVEVSNHLFGIAIDVDPDRNPCCGCVDPWPTNPVCKTEGPVYKRTALPKCWVQAFERYGFDWLGHDTLEDTMHFEFLGDPDRITR
jgi:D-alanyl-D-alanine carboxypeptidase